MLMQIFESWLAFFNREYISYSAPADQYIFKNSARNIILCVKMLLLQHTGMI